MFKKLFNKQPKQALSTVSSTPEVAREAVRAIASCKDCVAAPC